MASWHIGDVYPATATFRNAAGTPTNPTAAAVVVLLPDGTHTSATPTSDGSGVYHHNIPITQTGPHAVGFIGTGAVTAAEPEEFYVQRSPVLEPIA